MTWVGFMLTRFLLSAAVRSLAFGLQSSADGILDLPPISSPGTPVTFQELVQLRRVINEGKRSHVSRELQHTLYWFLDFVSRRAKLVGGYFTPFQVIWSMFWSWKWSLFYIEEEGLNAGGGGMSVQKCSSSAFCSSGKVGDVVKSYRVFISLLPKRYLTRNIL